ncbi:hypothetical protein Zmor_013643 [Zophobas morio]|uniref:RNA-polymerase II-associated protein 3-like C-terminal domain-containing protein n=1 Tax=Zophobas morio TaxID=2755281 RepID=A0AA38MES9_9CUCU|nr:hypothetical protein Zmor_013643 [Zophobas morio]
MVLHSDARKLIEHDESYSKVKSQPLIDKYKIPLQHFEYSYIETCKDGRELERIVQILRSGEEGYFPDLVRCAENRLAVVKPKSKVLRKACPVISKERLTREEKNELTNDLTQWISTVSKDDDELVYFKNRKPGGSLPEVRKTKHKTCEEKKDTPKRISSTDYSKWDKYDPDTEILKMDLEEEKLKKMGRESDKKKSPVKKTVQFKEFTTEVEALREANYEKDAGNEFYKAGDFKEALKHYTNSINIKHTVAGFNNRALVNIKLKRFKSAVDDCHSALAIEPDNFKAFLRKAQALDSLGRHVQALEAIEQAIEVDPNNSLAQELAQKFQKLCGIVPKAATRFVVQEIEKNKEVIIPIPGTSSMSPPHYITCSDGNLQKIKEHTMRANTRSQIVHLISIDSSDVEDDDCCTVNHLKKLCSNENLNNVKNTNKHNEIPPKINNTNIKMIVEMSKNEHHNSDVINTANTDQNTDVKKIKKRLVQEEMKKISMQQILKKDKNAGGEPYVKENECFDILQDIHSPYSFLKAWNSANIDRTLEQHALILKNIDMHRIIEVIGCKLDNTMFSTMIKCLCVHFAVPGEVDRLHHILENIVNLPRFDIISMLMSSEDTNYVNILINFLNQHGKPLSQEGLNKLFNSYCIPYIARGSNPA